MYINTTSRCWKRPMSSNSYRPHGSPLACRSKGKLEVEPCGWDEWLDNGLFQHREVVYMYTGLYYKESQHPDCATWLPIRIILHRVRIRIILQRVRTIRIMLQLSRSVLSKWSCDRHQGEYQGWYIASSPTCGALAVKAANRFCKYFST